MSPACKFKMVLSIEKLGKGVWCKFLPCQSALAGIRPGQGLLIPLGYLHPEKMKFRSDSKVGGFVSLPGNQSIT